MRSEQAQSMVVGTPGAASATLSANRVLRNTYWLLSATLFFGAAVPDPVRNKPHRWRRRNERHHGHGEPVCLDLQLVQQPAGFDRLRQQQRLISRINLDSAVARGVDWRKASNGAAFKPIPGAAPQFQIGNLAPPGNAQLRQRLGELPCRQLRKIG